MGLYMQTCQLKGKLGQFYHTVSYVDTARNVTISVASSK